MQEDCDQEPCEGPQGFTGAQGPGNVGQQGWQGFQGMFPPNGSEGPRGYQGPVTVGNQGFDGNQGPQGPSTSLRGPQGSQGPAFDASLLLPGPPGKPGLLGPIGSPGDSIRGTQGWEIYGFQGYQGDQGFQARDFPLGFRGPPAPTPIPQLNVTQTSLIGNINIPVEGKITSFVATPLPGSWVVRYSTTIKTSVPVIISLVQDLAMTPISNSSVTITPNGFTNQSVVISYVVSNLGSGIGAMVRSVDGMSYNVTYQYDSWSATELQYP